MLYVNTRNKADSYTAFRALTCSYADDGGSFLPIRLPLFEADQLQMLSAQPFNDVVAQILNVFFSVRLTGWDVEFAIGRKPINLVQINGKIVIAELWGSTVGNYSAAVSRLYDRLCENNAFSAKPAGWAGIAIRIAYLFGIYSEMKRMGIFAFDSCVAADDPDATMAMWYARQMGLPVERILCACKDGSWIWHLLHKGEVSTCVNPSDSVCSGIERLIYSTLGEQEAIGFVRAMKEGNSYKLSPEKQKLINRGLFASVISENRAKEIKINVATTQCYSMDLDSAICYGALQDYRAKIGENRITLLVADDAASR